jgi:NAD(P) transhydrogenase
MPEALKEYDLIVLGGGPAGIMGAGTAARCGKSIALIDSSEELGGAGVITGTVPSKTLRETAIMLSGARSRDLYGVDLSLRREATIADLMRHQQSVQATFSAWLEDLLKTSGAEVLRGTAEFVDSHTVRVRMNRQPAGSRFREGEIVDFRGAQILVATGSSPVRLPNVAYDSGTVLDSDTILHLRRLPKSMAVVGAGTIGCEYACVFAELHTQVHVIDGRSRALPFLDTEVSDILMRVMKKNGVIFHWNERVTTFEPLGGDAVALTLSSGATLRVETALVAAGRRGNTPALKTELAGIELGDRGLIPVDEHYRTEVPHIYAAGDVIGPPALASVGMEQARHAMRHAFAGGRRVTIPELLPTGVYTIPEIGMVGKTEDELIREGVKYVAGRARAADSARGRIIGETDGMLKLLFDRAEMKLLGVHAIGELATELVHIGLIAMLTGAKADLFDETCFNVPTLGAIYKTAALDAMGQALIMD